MKRVLILLVLSVCVATLASCAASQPVLTVAQKQACDEKGKAVILVAHTCQDAKSALDQLVYQDPTCKPFFQHSLSGTNCDFQKVGAK